MTEKDIINLGFKKHLVQADESGDKPYYFYEYDIFTSKGEYTYCALLTPANDEVKDEDGWTVIIFDYDLKVDNVQDVKDLIRILEKAAG
jgi:hypothetical protein